MRCLAGVGVDRRCLIGVGRKYKRSGRCREKTGAVSDVEVNDVSYLTGVGRRV